MSVQMRSLGSFLSTPSLSTESSLRSFEDKPEVSASVFCPHDGLSAKCLSARDRGVCRLCSNRALKKKSAEVKEEQSGWEVQKS